MPISQGHKMCDSAVMQSAYSHILNRSNSSSKVLDSCATSGKSDTLLGLVDEPHSDGSSLKVSNIVEGARSFGSCSSNSYPYRIQLEQDVQRLQQQLQKEMETNAILENAIEKNAVNLSCPSCLPPHAEELLSTIAVLEVMVSELEQEIVSLHFQLSQERNERRLAEYHLRHSASQSVSAHSDIMKTAISSSLGFLKQPGSEPCRPDEDNSCKDQ